MKIVYFSLLYLHLLSTYVKLNFGSYYGFLSVKPHLTCPPIFLLSKVWSLTISPSWTLTLLAQLLASFLNKTFCYRCTPLLASVAWIWNGGGHCGQPNNMLSLLPIWVGATTHGGSIPMWHPCTCPTYVVKFCLYMGTLCRLEVVNNLELPKYSLLVLACRWYNFEVFYYKFVSKISSAFPNLLLGFELYSFYSSLLWQRPLCFWIFSMLLKSASA